MKKFILALVALFAMVNVASAKDDVFVTSGSLVELKANNVNVFVEWDYSNATLEGKKVADFLAEKGPDWQNSYESELKRAEIVFATQLNKKSKTVTVVDDRNSADYVMTIKMGDFYYGSTGLSIVVGMGAGSAHMHADIVVSKGGAAVAEVKCDGVPGNGYGNEVRRTTSYLNLANWMVKLVKKAK